MMTLHDIWLLAPQVILAAGAVVVMLGIAVRRSHRFSWLFSLLTLLASFVVLCLQTAPADSATRMFTVDGTGRFFTGLLLAASFVIVVLAYPYFRARDTRAEEFYLLELLATVGAVTMVESAGFVAFFLSLEVLSVSLYGLIAYEKHESMAVEAGLKYLILAAVSSAFLLFGIALVYFQTGHLDLAGIGRALEAGTPGVIFLTGFALVLVGIGFKMALVPFHLWTPDVYSGAPAPVSAFVATISKGAVFCFLLRVYDSLHIASQPRIWLVMAIVAAASMLIGNWMGLRQQLIKRLLAYSSIAHLGYLLVALLAGGAWGARAGAFYLTAYFISMLGAFATVSLVSGTGEEARSLEDYRGLFFTRPWLAACFTAIMLSLAGIPLTAGFLGKLYVISAGASQGSWALLIILIASSTVGLFYYLKVVAIMFSTRKEAPGWGRPRQKSFPAGITVAVLFILLVVVGVYPASLLHLIEGMMTMLH